MTQNLSLETRFKLGAAAAFMLLTSACGARATPILAPNGTAKPAATVTYTSVPTKTPTATATPTQDSLELGASEMAQTAIDMRDYCSDPWLPVGPALVPSSIEFRDYTSSTQKFYNEVFKLTDEVGITVSNSLPDSITYNLENGYASVKVTNADCANQKTEPDQAINLPDTGFLVYGVDGCTYRILGESLVDRLGNLALGGTGIYRFELPETEQEDYFDTGFHKFPQNAWRYCAIGKLLEDGIKSVDDMMTAAGEEKVPDQNLENLLVWYALARLSSMDINLGSYSGSVVVTLHTTKSKDLIFDDNSYQYPLFGSGTNRDYESQLRYILGLPEPDMP